MNGREQVFYRCPCCLAHTLGESAADEICTLCGWQDDARDEQRAGEVWDGPNTGYSLAEARANVRAHGIMYRPSDRVFASARHPILGPAGETAIDRVALRQRAYAEFASFAHGRPAAAELPERLRALLAVIRYADRLYRPHS